MTGLLRRLGHLLRGLLFLAAGLVLWPFEVLYRKVTGRSYTGCTPAGNPKGR